MKVLQKKSHPFLPTSNQGTTPEKREPNGHQNSDENDRRIHGKASHTSNSADLHVTPWKIYMEDNDGGLEDDFPWQMGDF